MKEGVFWVISQIGTSTEKSRLIIKYNSTAGHSEIWETVKQEHPELAIFDYEHFPRGRVWIKNDVATIFLDPKINFPVILEKIKSEFELNGIIEIVNDSL